MYLKSITSTLTRLSRVIAVATIAAGLATTALAQNFNAAYRVDDSVVTYFDIDQMSRLLSALGQDPQQANIDATERLINYRLLKNLTSRTGTVIDESEIRSAVRLIAPDGDVAKFYADLQSQGVARETVDAYAESQILIRSYLQAKGVDTRISADEIAARVENIPDETRDLILVSEIVMPYAEYGGRIPTRFEANKVQNRIANGESFAAIARERSRSSTAANGGRLQPIPREALTPQLVSLLANTPVGGVAEPVEVEGAIILLQYTSNIQQTVSLPREPRVSYVELFIPARNGLAASKQTAQKLLQSLDNCEQATAILDGKDGRFDNVPVAALSSGLNLALGRMDTGERALFERENGTSVLVLCSRDVAVPADLQPQVNAAMASQAVDDRARGALLELRNQARVIKLN